MILTKIAVQVSATTSGLIAVFFVPLIYGFEKYGMFLRTALLSFVVHRLIDVMNEPLLATEKEENIFLACLINGLIIVVSVIVCCYYFRLKGLDIPLLISMMISSAYVSYLYKKNDFDLLKYYYVYIPTFIVLLILNVISDISYLFQLVAWVSIIISFVVGGIWKTSSICMPQLSDSLSSLKKLPRLACFSFSNIFIAYFYIYLLMDKLNGRELGELRYVLSLIQASVLFYPISMKHILKEFIEHGSEKIEDHMLRGFALLIALGLLMLFLNECLGGYFEYRIKVENLYAFIVFSPVLFVSYLVERLYGAKQNLLAVGIVSIVIYLPLIVLTQLIKDIPWLLGLFLTVFIYTFVLLIREARNSAILFILLFMALLSFYAYREYLLLIVVELLLLFALTSRKFKWRHG